MSVLITVVASVIILGSVFVLWNTWNDRRNRPSNPKSGGQAGSDTGTGPRNDE